MWLVVLAPRPVDLMLLLLLKQDVRVLLGLLPDVGAQLAPLVLQADGARVALFLLLQLLLSVGLAVLLGHCESALLGGPAPAPGLVVAAVGRPRRHGHVREGVRQVGEVHGGVLAGWTVGEVEGPGAASACWRGLQRPPSRGVLGFDSRPRRRCVPAVTSRTPRWAALGGGLAAAQLLGALELEPLEPLELDAACVRAWAALVSRWASRRGLDSRCWRLGFFSERRAGLRLCLKVNVHARVLVVAAALLFK